MPPSSCLCRLGNGVQILTKAFVEGKSADVSLTSRPSLSPTRGGRSRRRDHVGLWRTSGEHPSVQGNITFFFVCCIASPLQLFHLGADRVFTEDQHCMKTKHVFHQTRWKKAKGYFYQYFYCKENTRDVLERSRSSNGISDG